MCRPVWGPFAGWSGRPVGLLGSAAWARVRSGGTSSRGGRVGCGRSSCPDEVLDEGAVDGGVAAGVVPVGGSVAAALVEGEGSVVAHAGGEGAARDVPEVGVGRGVAG